MDRENEFVLPEDLQDVEIIYSDGEDHMCEDEEDPMGEDEENENEELEDMSSLTFNSHEKSVFTVDISPNDKYAVSGGEDDMAYVWDINTKEVLISCNGHKDSVTQAAFSRDGKYVATGDMAGVVNVWNVSEKKLEWSSEMGDLEWFQWHPIINALVAGYQSGEIYVWQIPKGNCKVLPSHGHTSTCGKVLPDGKQLVAGYEDGQIKLWDIKTENVIWKKSFNTEIRAIDINSQGTLLGICPTTEFVKISNGQSVFILEHNDKNDIETILVSTELDIIVTGSISGEVCIWSLSQQMLRHKLDIQYAVTVLKLSGNGEILIGCSDGKIYVCNTMAGTIKKVLTGHVNSIWSIAVPKTGNFIITSADDTTVKVFSL